LSFFFLILINGNEIGIGIGNRLRTYPFYSPKQIYNPVLRRYDQCIYARALEPDEPLPPPDPSFIAPLNPDDRVWLPAIRASKAFAECFEISKGKLKMFYLLFSF